MGHIHCLGNCARRNCGGYIKIWQAWEWLWVEGKMLNCCYVTSEVNVCIKEEKKQLRGLFNSENIFTYCRSLMEPPAELTYNYVRDAPASLSVTSYRNILDNLSRSFRTQQDEKSGVRWSGVRSSWIRNCFRSIGQLTSSSNSQLQFSPSFSFELLCSCSLFSLSPYPPAPHYPFLRWHLGNRILL